VRSLAHAGVRVGEGALTELLGVDLGGDADDAELVSIERLLDLGVRERAPEERPVDIDNREVADLPREIDGFDDVERLAIAVVA
jgi:hypothetical protein